jgi:hypothetical protein
LQLVNDVSIADTSEMGSHRPTQADNTAAMLQQAVHDGLPVLILGALEIRVRRPTPRPANGYASPPPAITRHP